MARLSENDIFAGSGKEMPREGTLLPETYKFPRGMTREQVLQRMQQAQKRVLAEIWDRRSPDIPVKIAGAAGDAGLDHREGNRQGRRTHAASPRCSSTGCSSKMKLQSDPTIIYGLVGGKGTLGRPIKRTEIQQPTALQHLRDPRPSAGTDRQSRAAPRWRPRPIRRARAICSSSPTAPAATPSPKPTTSIRRTSPSCARWKSRSRTTPSNRRLKRPSRPRPVHRPLPIPTATTTRPVAPKKPARAAPAGPPRLLRPPAAGRARRNRRRRLR